MGFTQKLLGQPSIGWSKNLRLPEYRQIELYTKRKALTFLPAPTTDDLPLDRIAAVAHAALLFEATFAEIYPSELPLTSWARCKELPKRTRIEKILAELHRILRIVRKVSFHSHGHADMRDGIICLNGAIDMVVLSLEITAAGLDLLETMTAYWLVNRDGVFPDAYIEIMLGEYFCDLVAEIKRFSDEDRILYQFRRGPPFNRHFRFDCDNPKVTASDGKLTFEIGERYCDAARYPIDFYLVWDDALHIIPVEIVKNAEFPCEELPRWRARTPDALSLPASFRTRFAREKIVIGQPMT